MPGSKSTNAGSALPLETAESAAATAVDLVEEVVEDTRPRILKHAVLNCGHGKQEKAVKKWQEQAPTDHKIVSTVVHDCVPPKAFFQNPRDVTTVVLVWYTVPLVIVA